ncbi:MAG: large conductance mechanosensitive channel protein MscL [Anaerolineae bacterium]
MWNDFKAFVMRGNVLDLAVGVIIGAAFGRIVTSMVEDIIMPPLGLILGRVNFIDMFMCIDGRSYPSQVAAKAAGAPCVYYGAFITNILTFLITAAAIFLIVHWFYSLFPKQDSPAKTKLCPFCASAIPLAAVRCPACTSDLRETPVNQLTG